jgi:hypothetical protein
LNAAYADAKADLARVNAALLAVGGAAEAQRLGQQRREVHAPGLVRRGACVGDVMADHVDGRLLGLQARDSCAHAA